MRAWLAILRERHPNVTWVPANPTSNEQEITQPEALAA
jgi:hypothetical protein